MSNKVLLIFTAHILKHLVLTVVTLPSVYQTTRSSCCSPCWVFGNAALHCQSGDRISWALSSFSSAIPEALSSGRLRPLRFPSLIINYNHLPSWYYITHAVEEPLLGKPTTKHSVSCVSWEPCQIQVGPPHQPSQTFRWDVGSLYSNRDQNRTKI